MNRIRAIAAALALFFSATAANASLVMNWSFTGTGASTGTNGSGTFTARGWDEGIDGSFTAYLSFLGLNEGAPYVEKQSDFYVMTSATGNINGKSISLLDKYAATVDAGSGITSVTSGFQGNDNVVLEPHPDNANAYYGYFTNFGVSFIDADSVMWNLFVPYNPAFNPETYSPSYRLINSFDDTTAIGDFTLATTEGGRVDAVPVPGAAWLLLSGVGSFFLASRRRFSAASAR